MKRYAIYLLALFLTAFLASCGGGSSSSLGSAPTQTTEYQLTTDKLAFDLSNQDNPIVPLPNDLLWARTGGYLYIPPDKAPDTQTQALYEAIDALKIKGFSPNAPIAIPLATDEITLDATQLQKNVQLIDMTTYVGTVLADYLAQYLQTVPDDPTCSLYAQDQDNETLAIGCFSDIMNYYAQNDPATLAAIVQNASQSIYAPIIVKQNGTVINAYPTKPLNPGHRYVCVVLNGIDNLQEASMFALLKGDTPLTGQYEDLEPLREEYQPVFNLLATLGITKDEVLEMFTFTTADKTLGLKDYAAIQASLNRYIPIMNPDSITGYSYVNLSSDNISNEYLNLDQLSDLPLLCQHLYDNVTIRNLYQLPRITDMLETFMLTPNVYQAAYIEGILQQYQFPVNQNNLPYVCKAIFDNSSLYDNITVAQANPDATGGLMVYIHGLTKTKDDIYAIKDAFPNIDIFAIDLPWHGDRIPPNPTLASMCESQYNGSCFLTTNAIMDVMNIYQSIMDTHVLLKFLALADYTMLPQVGEGPVPIYLASQSMGSIIGSMLLRVDNVTRSAYFDNVSAQLGIALPDHNFITRAVLNVGGATYASILNEAENKLILGMLESAGVERGNLSDYLNYYMTIYLFQTLLDPVDPAYMARDAAISSKVIVQSANHDTVVPNISNQLLAACYGFDNYTSIDCSSTTVEPSTTPGWYMFGVGDNWVNHGFFVSTDNLSIKYPEAIDHLNQAYVDNAQELARKQADNFFDNTTAPSGAGGGDI